VLRRGRSRIHTKSLSAQLWERVRGVEESLVEARNGLPPVDAVYPRGRSDLADALSETLHFTFPALPPDAIAPYRAVLDRLPPLLVVELRSRNTCSCLGHHHEWPNLSRLSRSLAKQIDGEVGEIDLAIDSIRAWEPRPLSTLAAVDAAPCDREELDETRFHSAILAVFLHELEHLVFPARAESDVRRHSDDFYLNILNFQLADRFGLAYSI
jgi:hypothetical protein